MAEPQHVEKDLTALLNAHRVENESSTPDFILAQYLLGCLRVFSTAIQQRETWHARGEGKRGDDTP